MKPTKDIIGLRIISISDGTKVGAVKDIVLNAAQKRLGFIIVDQPTDFLGAKVIAFSDLLGIGEFATTIQDRDVIQDVAQNSEAQNLLKQDIRVLETKVLTKKGQLIGEVKEILINEETGQLAACFYEFDGQMHEIGAERIITLGKELLIVDLDSQLTDIPKPQVKETIIEFQSNDLGNNDSVNFEPDAPTEDEFKDNSIPPIENNERILEVDIDNNYIKEPETNFNLFEQRQLQYFIGKAVEKDIVLDNSEILRAGEIITSEIVSHITTRSTLMEITSHLQKN